MNNFNFFEKKVYETVRKYSMLSQNDRVLVGLSGGKDSCVLLYVLYRLSAELGITLTAFHLNHSIRGEEALRDELFSKAFSEKLKIPFCTDTVDVPAAAKKCGTGLEVTARNIRYSEFGKFAALNSCNKIATAHTLSDNTESVFISLMRSGTLSQIPPVRDNIIRPMIECTTEEVVEYAAESGIDYIFDSTNASTDYLRNFLRLSVLPQFRAKSPGFDETVSRAGKIFSSYRALAQREGEKYFENNSNPESLLSLRELALDETQISVFYYVISKILEKQNVFLTFERFEKIAELIKEGQTGKSVSLSGNKELFIGYNSIYVEDKGRAQEPFFLPLKRGVNVIPNSPYSVIIETCAQYEERKTANKQKVNKITKNILIDCNIINNDFYARSRKSGDKYICRSVTRSVKKYLIDAKIDRNLRDFFPIVCDKDGIVWVPGLGIADRIKKENTGEELSVSLEISDGDDK